MWHGDYRFLLSNLIQKDFKIRYRNMSLGVLWSLLNPLVTMGVLTVVFTVVWPNPDIKPFPIFLLCGLVPFNFFTLAWGTATSSLADSAAIIKRVPVPREVIPISTVLGNCLHLLIQIALLLLCTLVFGKHINWNWLWMPYVWAMFVVFVCGLSLISSAVNIYVRDTRYVVESFNAVLFWLVPIVYSGDKVPRKYVEIINLNPVAAVVQAMRKILMEATAPAPSLLLNLTWCSLLILAVGILVFRRMKQSFYDYL